MKLPTIKEIPKSRTMIDAFRGYNHNLRIGDSEFYDMKNMTSSYYPVLSPRQKRGIYAKPDNPQGLITKDAVCYVDGTDFVINEYRISMGLSTAEKDCPKTLVSMGAYVIIMPDKKYVKTIANEDDGFFENGPIEASIETNTAVTFELCKIDGVGYEDVIKSSSEPDDPVNMDLWLDTSSTPHSLKQYSEINSTWTVIATTYIKISAPNIGIPFEEGDGVTISGIENEQLSDLNNTMIIWAKGDDYIVVTGILDAVTTQENPITIKRQMPNMDFIIESGNRLWGCRYGTALNGEVVNEIYASKLGDFKNWNSFAGISTDSYAATVGTDGQFTGAIAHLSYPLFFKENCVHKVYGNYPSNYQIQTTDCRGVQKGCSRSLAIVNETLYYKSRSSVCAYDGSLPYEISSALGEESYKDAVAGTLGNKYYISMKDSSDTPHLFVYDILKGMWHKEDNTEVYDFCTNKGELYYIDRADNYIKTILGSGEKDNSDFQWMIETGIIGTDTPDKKYISRVDIRMSIEITAKVYFFIQYNSTTEWKLLKTMNGTTLTSFTFPIKPRRCDHFRIRIIGEGEAKIFSIAKTIEQGSDV